MAGMPWVPGRVLASLLLWTATVEAATGRWCERTVQVTAEEEVTPRREDAVPCASLYHYSLAGWRIDRDRMRQAYGGDRGEPHRDAGSGTPLCYIYNFDGTHFHFSGECTYSLAAAADGTWAVSIAAGDPRALHMTFGMDTVVARGRNLSVNGMAVLEGQPYLHNGISVAWPGDGVAVASGLGVRVTSDGHQAVTVTVDTELWGSTRGLCGPYNDDPTALPVPPDDLLQPTGDVAAFATSFGNSWKIPAAGSEVLGDAAELGPGCTTGNAARRVAETVCGELLAEPFRQCHGQVDPGGFYAACLELLCWDGDTGPVPPPAACDTFAAYARDCAQHQTYVDWRRPGFCGEVTVDEREVTLPFTGAELNVRQASSSFLLLQTFGTHVLWGLEAPTTYITLQPAFANKVRGLCGTYNWNQQDEFTTPMGDVETSVTAFANKYRVSGSCSELRPFPLEPCSAFAGQRELVEAACAVLHSPAFQDGRCVSPEECPCHHGGRPYQPNDTIVRDCNTCVCRGQRWHCGREECAGTCVATGDPHYVTFDGRAFSFLGDCEYLLAREVTGLFAVTTENVPCGTSGVTCTKSVVVVMGNTIVHMLRGRDVTVNGVSVRPPKVYSGSGLTLERTGLFLLLLSRLGLAVLWDGGTRVYVRLEPQHRGRVAGLCGNFDGDAENDFSSRQGVLEPTPELFGNSWRLSLLCPEVNSADTWHPCTVRMGRKTRCSVLRQRLFAPCHDAVPCQRFYDWCIFDACGCDSGGDCECLCTAIAAYAEECGRRGIHIRWRSQELCREPPPPPHGGCIKPVECPCFWDGFAFPAGAAVQQGCKNCTCAAGQWRCPSSPEPCPAAPSCAEGEFSCRADGRCVPGAWVCDNEEDCGDGSDEVCAPRCAPHQPRCAGGQCLAWGARCDGVPDCTDGSDESGCAPPTCIPPEFGCASGRCLPPERVCDGELDCGFADDSDEAGCSPSCGAGEFRCAVGRCVPYPHRCDGRDDCGDSSDERGCGCPPGHFQCPDTRCLSPAAVCDSHRDCTNGTDEAFCPVPACGPYAFTCGSGECAPRGWVCDGESDCRDGSDELGCASGCEPGHFPCAHGTDCVPYGQLCDGVPHCHDRSDESTDHCGSTTIPPCPGHFACDDGVCLNMSRVCDGATDCPQGEDELACGSGCTAAVPAAGDNGTAMPPTLMTEPPSATPAEPPDSPLLTFPLPPLGDPCYRPLGTPSLPDSSFAASSAQAGTPAHAARLHGGHPGQELRGWAPPDDAYPALLSEPPFLQLDLLEPTNVTGVVVQGAGSSDAFVTAFLLQFSTDGSHWHGYREVAAGGQPKAKIFQGNRDAGTPAVRLLGRMVQARHVRILPQDFHNRIVLRVELLGCPPVPVTMTVPVVTVTMLVTPSQRPCGVGEFQCRNGGCVPGGPHGALCDGIDDCGDLSDELPCGPALPRLLCPRGQFTCGVLGCLDAALVCDGRSDCLDGSDEASCGSPPTSTSPLAWPTPTGGPPPTCPPKQFSCGSGGCLPPEKRCDLHPDCPDGSDESGCACGPQMVFVRAGDCEGGQVPPCPQTCGDLSTNSTCQSPCQEGECVSCGGGERLRRRQCQQPVCPGLGLESQICNTQVCRGRGCPPGMALVACANRCPRHCRDLQEGLACGQDERCQPGCRCPNGESCLCLQPL
ncbi:hypothetical protein Q9233_015180 [Columba guinea]|nr:hypothetical protein Q9233_015180 [Columba guinea]